MAIFLGVLSFGKDVMGQIRTGKKLLPVLAACTIWGFSAPSFAEDFDELTPSYEQCLLDHGESTAGMLDCVQEAYEYWDAELNRAYKAAQANCREIGRSEDAEEGEKCLNDLKQMQRAWIKDRDKVSELIGFTVGGRDGFLNMGRVDALLRTVYMIRAQASLLTPAEY